MATRRKAVRIRERNQITLPAEIASALHVHPGDYLEVFLMDKASIRLTPARLATIGTPEAEIQERRAEEDITAGRYGTFKGAEAFANYLLTRRKRSRGTALEEALEASAFFAPRDYLAGKEEPRLGETIALVNLGGGVMNINILKDGLPLFTRDVSIGANEYNDALQKELDLTFEDAIRLKQGHAVSGVTEGRKEQILRSVSEVLVTEILKSFEFFLQTSGGGKIERIYVPGGSTRAPGLIELLGEGLNVPVQELHPFAHGLSEIEYTNVSNLQFDARVLGLLPQLMILQHKVLPLAFSKNRLTLGMVNPTDLIALDEVRRVLKGVIIERVVISDEGFKHFMTTTYVEMMRKIEGELTQAGQDFGFTG